MGSPMKSWREQVFGPERARNLKSRLFVLLRDELGLGKQPKVARLLVDEITLVLNDSLLDVSCLKPGQLLTLAPEIGQGPSWHNKRLEDKKMKAVILDLLDPDDIEALAKGDPIITSGLPVWIQAHGDSILHFTRADGRPLPLKTPSQDCSTSCSSSSHSTSPSDSPLMAASCQLA